MALLRALWEDSRISFNRLGKILGISGNILKKRAEQLENKDGSGVFIYHTNPVFSKFGFQRIIYTFGFDRLRRDELIKLAGEVAEIYELMFSLDGEAAVTALLPIKDKNGVSEELIAEFKKKIEKKFGVEVHNIYKLIHFYDGKKVKLKPMEIKLLRLLRENSRRDLVYLSEKLSLSKKTLSRYLSRFTKAHLIKHTIGLQPANIKNFVIYILYLCFKEECVPTREELLEKVAFLKEKIGKWLSYYILVGYKPGAAFYIYDINIAKLQERVEELKKLDFVEDIKIFFPSDIIRFEKWKELVIPAADEEKRGNR